MIIEIPEQHFLHLRRLEKLRRITLDEALDYAVNKLQPCADNWIEKKWGASDVSFKMNTDHSLETVLQAIQGISSRLRPVTDGPYLENFELISSNQPGLHGIAHEGVTIYDFHLYTRREQAIYPLVSDLLPPMTLEQYRLYATFCSQYLRLVREPELFTMPHITGRGGEMPCVDAGAYVGYKALAFAQFNGGQPNFAMEMDSENFDVLKLNAKANPKANIVAHQTALSNECSELKGFTRQSKTMGHSLANFQELKEKDSVLANQQEENVFQTVTLDSLLEKVDAIGALHISVNGFEPEVCQGAITSLKKSRIIRISTPYDRNGVPVREMVLDVLRKNQINIFGRSGGAVVAGIADGCHYEKIP